MTENTSKKQKYKYPAPFCLRFTEDERKTLELAAGDRPLGAYIRWLIFGDEIPKNRTRGKKPVKDQKELAKLLALFGQSRIASNMNQLARHLMNGDKNEHVTIHEVSGFASDNISDALNEIHAISKGTRCSRFMFSLSLSPPQNVSVPAEIFENALSRIEKMLGNL